MPDAFSIDDGVLVKLNRSYLYRAEGERQASRSFGPGVTVIPRTMYENLKANNAEMEEPSDAERAAYQRAQRDPQEDQEDQEEAPPVDDTAGNDEGEPEELPADLPARDLLIAAGLDTRSKVANASEDQILEINGIGKVTYQDIRRQARRWRSH